MYNGPRIAFNLKFEICHLRWSILLAFLHLASCAAAPIHQSPLQLARESAFIAVTVHDCYDGDTCTVSLHDLALPQVFARQIPVRLAGIDTPERKSPCADERRLAADARNYLRAILSRAIRVDLVQVDRDKYFRLLARLVADGQDLSDALLRAGLAHHYQGGPKTPWC